MDIQKTAEILIKVAFVTVILAIIGTIVAGFYIIPALIHFLNK